LGANLEDVMLDSSSDESIKMALKALAVKENNE
jgi:hypothetical protein